MCQQSTTGVFSEAMGVVLPEHLGRDQHNTFGRNMKPFSIFRVIKADARTIRNAATAINQGIAYVAVAANFYIRIDDRI
jgi:hypothetical protein